MKKIKYIIASASLLPGVAYAQYLNETHDLLNTIEGIIELILIPLVFTLALLLFFWGMAKYIRSVGSDKEEGRQLMVWGIVALFVMSSVWGLVNFVRGELNINQNGPMQIPKVTN